MKNVNRIIALASNFRVAIKTRDSGIVVYPFIRNLYYPADINKNFVISEHSLTLFTLLVLTPS